jgi:hypothetical protein
VRTSSLNKNYHKNGLCSFEFRITFSDGVVVGRANVVLGQEGVAVAVEAGVVESRREVDRNLGPML